VPTVRKVSVCPFEPLVAQTLGVSLVKVTGDTDAVAINVVEVPAVLGVSGLNVIIWGLGTVTDRSTTIAAFQLLSPNWDALMEQVPPVREYVTVAAMALPTGSVQTPGVWDAKLTGRLEVAVAATSL
jgi:hypothetical protein